VAIVWNDRQSSREPLLVEYEALLRAHCPAYGEDLRRASGEALAAELLGPGRCGVLHVPNPQALDWEAFAGRTRSASYAPRDEPGRSALFMALRALFERHQRGGRVAFTLDTLAYHARG
jgi:hypothetical protein